ncbi:hypothetical protein DNL40_11865 [Xylanimonas oleitrophica]|uniref:Carrier domain-containing protein n=1 Tax=Xylanimonas oleitrophica TaxID=2607479 RepID=A0A2W5WM28_9MICO|nr:phosphopantetheine-binding protein [Xylanimonas oleitrophica]PZR52367.1 hypothetical protein DNL40_11865 [Xylanimonas oleitrophica]
MSTTRVATLTRAVWTEALGIEVDESTDFFLGGGHSFLAIDIVARLGDELGVEIPLRALFDQPVLGEFTAVVEQIVQSGPAA